MNMFRVVAPELLSTPAVSLEWFDVRLRIRVFSSDPDPYFEEGRLGSGHPDLKSL